MGAYQLPPLCFHVMKTISKLQLFYCCCIAFYSLVTATGGVEDLRLEAKAKDTKKSEAKSSFPRTNPLEAKDGNALGQGSRTQPQVFSKKKDLQKSFSGNLQFIGVARIFDWGDPNHKSHALMSSKICLLALNQDFAKGEGLN